MNILDLQKKIKDSIVGVNGELDAEKIALNMAMMQEELLNLRKSIEALKK